MRPTLRLQQQQPDRKIVWRLTLPRIRPAVVFNVNAAIVMNAKAKTTSHPLTMSSWLLIPLALSLTLTIQTSGVLDLDKYKPKSYY